MIFSSVAFLFYFLPVALILYYGLFFSNPLKNGILLILSLIFYAWGEPKFVLLMILSIVVNYFLALIIDIIRDKKSLAKFFLLISCIYNLGMLFIFKYLTFVIRNINKYQNNPITVPNMVLPIGISFFTFQALSYVIDVYRKSGVVQKNPFYVGLYISFFPQLVAGPIVKYSTIAEQIKNRKETWEKFSVGTCRFITGLGKKVLISNSMAIVADRIFGMSEISPIAASLAWIGSIAYTLQIFYDFSGYSDMAIGMGLMFGFKFEENFNYPYISKSISEFWRRWHISLGSWFKDYVYFPLGGSRVSNKDKMIRNLLVVWLLTGIWHGAEWTFIVWGLLNFVFIALEKIISFEKIENIGIFKHIYTLFLVNLGWVIFRSLNLYEAGKYISYMFGLSYNGFFSDYTLMFIKEYSVFFILGIVFSTPIAKYANKLIVENTKGTKLLEYVYPFAIMILFIIVLSYLVKGSYNPFIYFNF
ncbi:MAG: MBOAT family protein [Peptostreptococcaceae bacterium]|nr:MBOAT family protein [Peptostreptococcaceae bacterium]